MEKHSRVYAEIDLDAISYNMEQMKKRVGEGAKFIAVVKTDGYGHGAVPIACMLDDDPDVWGYATATLEEAVELHRAGIQKPTMVLGCVFPDQYEEMIKGVRAGKPYLHDDQRNGCNRNRYNCFIFQKSA